MPPPRLKRSNTSGAVPASLEDAEIAINQADGKIFYRTTAGGVGEISGGGAAYTLPTASSGQLGGIRVGDGLQIANGVLSVNAGSGLAISGGAVTAAGTNDSRWDLFLPPAPTSVTAIAGNGQATVSWTAPTVLPQLPITDYRVQVSSNGGSTWSLFTDSVSAATSAAVTGLTNGTAYVFRVAAVTGIGQGPWSSASSAVTPSTSRSVRYLVVAGGGGGGGNDGGGGGGGGGVRSGTTIVSPGVSLSVTVGAGGSGGTMSVFASNGGNSAFDSITSLGGGGGGAPESYGNFGRAGASGGSGGGGPRDSYMTFMGGLGEDGQGYAGGNSVRSADGSAGGGGGGGGAGANGGYDIGALPSGVSEGGIGFLSDITGSSLRYAGGGGGAAKNNAPAGGNGGGGNGAGGNFSPGGNGTAGLGGGGGGGLLANGGAGGSGVVIVRVSIPAALTTGSPQVTTAGSDTVYTFTQSGSITF